MNYVTQLFARKVCRVLARWSWIAMVVIAVMALAYLLNAFQAEQGSTASDHGPTPKSESRSVIDPSWQKYEDQDLGITISVPSNWAAGDAQQSLPLFPKQSRIFRGNGEWLAVAAEHTEGTDEQAFARALVGKWTTNEARYEPSEVAGLPALKVLFEQPSLNSVLQFRIDIVRHRSCQF